MLEFQEFKKNSENYLKILQNIEPLENKVESLNKLILDKVDSLTFEELNTKVEIEIDQKNNKLTETIGK